MQKTPLPPSEVMTRPERRSWSFEEKLRIVQEAERCEHGEIGALLRRENLYASQLSTWRRAFRKHGEEGLKPAPMGRPPKLSPQEKASQKQLDDLERKNKTLERELERARVIIEVQKKLCELLNLPTGLDTESAGGEP